LAAIRSVRKMQPKKIIFACGVCASDVAKLIRQEVDEIVAISIPEVLFAVGQWYRDFGETADADVMCLLNHENM